MVPVWVLLKKQHLQNIYNLGSCNDSENDVGVSHPDDLADDSEDVRLEVAPWSA